MLREMVVRPGDHILEVGCGTARNLIKLARQHPDAHFYGLDASQEMLNTAAEKVAAAQLTARVTLRPCLAENLDPQATFGLDRPFDTIFFSYSLSMIPTWHEALAAALRGLRPGGSIQIVDFWDQADLPRWFRSLLRDWLRLFHVQHRPELLEHLHALADREAGRLILVSIGRRYAFLAHFEKPAVGQAPSGAAA
jgi:S-adenosylmethionine-diacylgycerolhomoserine-N-methlytransferase